jgi:hypothetical protein
MKSAGDINMGDIVKGLGKAVTSIFGMEGPPAPEEKAVAPTPDDKAMRRAREKRAMRRYSGAGRAGTMLTDESGKLG